MFLKKKVLEFFFFYFELPKLSTEFTVLAENILELKIHAFLLLKYIEKISENSTLLQIKCTLHTFIQNLKWFCQDVYNVFTNIVLLINNNVLKKSTE